MSFLPQYSVLHLGDDGVDSGYHTLRDLIDFTATSFIPSLSANKQNVVVRIPILDAAAGSSSPYTMVNAQFRTAFGRRRATVDTVTVENWHETMSQPRTFSPIILVYGTQPGAIRAPATPPSWNSWSPRADVINGLSIGTLAIAKDAQIVERVIPAQLARLNAITTLVPTVHLGYKYSCPGMVYLESSGDGTNAADGMWQPVLAVDAVHSASRTYVYQSTSSCTTTTVVNGVTERTQTYTCRLHSALTRPLRVAKSVGYARQNDQQTDHVKHVQPRAGDHHDGEHRAELQRFKVSTLSFEHLDDSFAATLLTPM